ncbi:hypothetical protein Hanom_Chr03g00220241 [Helianthus anomalus]
MGVRDGDVSGFDTVDASHMALWRRHDIQVRRTRWWGYFGSPASAMVKRHPPGGGNPTSIEWFCY